MARIRWAEVVERAREVVLGYGGDVTLRQTYYKLTMAGVIPHTASSYKHLSSHLARARREDRFPDLIDTMRRVHEPPAWEDATEMIGQVPGWFRLDRTRGQEVALYVAAEKDTLRAQFTGWLDELGIPVIVVRGYGSQSYVQVVRDRTATETREVRLAYFGDFDASGEGIEQDWIARTGCWDTVERVLLTNEQRIAYGLPPTEGKKGDPRWSAFAAKYGFDPARPVQWEVEALERNELHALLMAAVEPYVDREILAEVLADEQRQRAQLQTFVNGWPRPPASR
ncbi:hypothetical protein [Streptomyces sp. NRRL WC-3742]|uniref:hypothetical protein n=1 Tax=Streptomyces sp. NRRL WC-3742 TaxID=1463934 RepID=UPI00068A8652|nr:hypothetical protein [Streptomyces sp. NRRL WC-3742]